MKIDISHRSSVGESLPYSSYVVLHAYVMLVDSFSFLNAWHCVCVWCSVVCYFPIY